MFYQALIQSVITFGISCWGGNITEGDKQKINRSIKKAGKIVGEELPLLKDLYKKHSITKALNNATLFGMHTKFQEDQEDSLLSTAKQNVIKKSFVPETSRKLSESITLRKN